MSRRDIRTLGDAEARLLLNLASQDKQVFTSADAQEAVEAPTMSTNCCHACVTSAGSCVSDEGSI